MILERYIARQVLGPMLLIVVLLETLFLTYSLTRYLTDAASGLLTLGEVLRISLLRGVIALEVLVPVGLYIAIILGMGRLHSDSEIYAMRSAGVSNLRLLRPVVTVALVVAAAVWGASMLLRPWAYGTIDHLRAQAEASDELRRIRPGQFYHFDDGDRTVFIRALGEARGELESVFIRTRSQRSVEVIASAHGRVEEYVTPSEHLLQLTAARVFRTNRGELSVFGQFGDFRLTLPAAVFEAPPARAKTSSSSALARSSIPKDRAEYQWRLSTGLSTLLLALLAVPLSQSGPRQGRYARVMIAVIIYAVYYIVMGVARTWVEQAQVPTLFWAPFLLALAVSASYLLWQRGAR